MGLSATASDFSAGTAGASAVGWPGDLRTKPIIPRPPPQRPVHKYLSQATPAEAPPPAAAAVNPVDAGIKAETEKRWDEAERLYREALAKEPNRVDLLLHLAHVLAAEGKLLDSAQITARAADLRPQDGELQLHASEAFGAAGHAADAASYNDRALALHPDDSSLLRRRADLAIWLGNNAMAAETLKKLSDAAPNDLQLRLDLAKVLGWQGKWGDAAEVFSGYVSAHPDDKEALLNLARIQAAGGDADGARQTLQRFRTAGGDETTYQSELNKVASDINAPIRAEMEKRYGDAERMYREMLARDPTRMEVLLRLVDLLATEGKRLEAAKTMAKAADLKPDDVDLQRRASEAYGAAGRLEDAVRYADRALALHPDDPTLRRRRAELDIWAGKFAQAEKTLRALIAANPDDPTLKRDLARVLVDLHHLPEAADLMAQYVAQHPEDKEAVLDLAGINAARGNPQKNAELLELYEKAGGEEATFRRELARARPAPGAVARRTPAGVAGGTRPPINIPPAVIKAESAKQWGEAVRLLRSLLAKEPNRVDLWLRLVDNLAVQKKSLEAAEAMSKAADLRPQDVELQSRASQAFAVADRPADALRYIDRAVALRPDDLELHRRRAEIATWAGANAEAEESLRILIAADGGDLKLRLDLGRVVGWQGRLDEAAAILSDYVARQPTEKEGLLALSRVQAGRGDFASAVDLLGRYADAGGDRLTFDRDLALDLAWAGRIDEPLALADATLSSNPQNFQAHLARAVALHNGLEDAAAAAEIDTMAALSPNAPELNGLRRSILTPTRSYLQFDTGARWESDNVSAQSADLSYHQRVNDVWWVFAGADGDLAEALGSSAFAPIQGGTTLGRGGGFVGAQARLDTGTLGSARIGATSTERTTTPTWLVAVDSRPADDLRVQLSNSHDLQIITPRSLSLGITRIDTVAQVTYTPDLAWTVAGLAQEGEFSDDNHLWHALLAPRRAVLRTEKWNIDLGVAGDWFGYSKNVLLTDGYYSPSFYQHYWTSGYIYYKMSEENGLSFIASYGVNKDDSMPRFKFTQDYSAEATFGALSDWMFKIRGSYTNHGSLGPSFSAESVGLTVIRRF